MKAGREMKKQCIPSGTTGVVCLVLGCLCLPAVSQGTITGTIDQPDAVRTVTAVNRQGGKRFSGSIDPATGRFIVGGLPLDATYDCIIEYTGARLEGVNMKVPRSDYVEEHPLQEEDIPIIQDKIRNMNRFEDVLEILGLQGNIQHAAIVVNKLRTKPFYDSKPGEVVWRLELWHYECPEETWHKVQDELSIVLYRERIPRAEYDKKSLTLDPALGGLRLTADAPEIDIGKVALPPAKPGIRLRAKPRGEDDTVTAATGDKETTP
jgi:hypothetical protein